MHVRVCVCVRVSACVKVKVKVVFFIKRSIQSVGPLKALYTFASPGRLVHSNTNSASPGSVICFLRLFRAAAGFNFLQVPDLAGLGYGLGLGLGLGFGVVFTIIVSLALTLTLITTLTVILP